MLASLAAGLKRKRPRPRFESWDAREQPSPRTAQPQSRFLATKGKWPSRASSLALSGHAIWLCHQVGIDSVLRKSPPAVSLTGSQLGFFLWRSQDFQPRPHISQLLSCGASANHYEHSVIGEASVVETDVSVGFPTHEKRDPLGRSNLQCPPSHAHQSG
jgi:hypothetical protein